MDQIRISADSLVMVPINRLIPYERNARRHDAKNLDQLRTSLKEFGFVAPILIDEDYHVVAGHGRLEAAKLEMMDEVPCVFVSGLSETQKRAYILADNRLAETSAWDSELLKLELDELNAINFDIGLIGFELSDFVAAPLDLDDDPPAETFSTKDETLIHCPKCGFKFEAAK